MLILLMNLVEKLKLHLLGLIKILGDKNVKLEKHNLQFKLKNHNH